MLKAVTALLEENGIFQALLCVFFFIFQVKMSYLNKELGHTVAAHRTVTSFFTLLNVLLNFHMLNNLPQPVVRNEANCQGR